MSALAGFRRDVRALTPVNLLIVAITPLGAFALGLLIVFPSSFA